jgi:hypothetical protein
VTRQALAALALVVVFAAAALVARSERVYSVGEVRTAFASEGLRLAFPRPIGLIPGCPSAWSLRHWAWVLWSRPSGACDYAVFITRGLPAVVYVLPSEPDTARYADRPWDTRYQVIERRANVLVLAEEREQALEAALAALE